MFRVAYCHGLRASEVALLQVSDYREKAGRLFVHRLKGSNSGEFSLFRSEHASLRAYMKERGFAPGPIFLSRNGRGISRRRLDQLMKHYCRIAGIDAAKAHFHALKHSRGTHLLAEEGNIIMVQDALGHRNIQNTLIYSHIGNKQRDEMFERHRDKW